MTGEYTTEMHPGPVTSATPTTAGDALRVLLDDTKSVERVPSNQADPRVVEDTFER